MEFVHHFEGAPVLDELLRLAGSAHDSYTALQEMRRARGEGRAAREVIPTLFEGEPRFGSPELAQRLFQNLLGLWALLAEGKPVRLEGEERPARPRKEKPVAPEPFAPGEPDAAFVEAAWRYLEDDAKARTRLGHAFENKQDGLLGALDGAGLSDEGYGVARHLLFESYGMLELGWSQGVASVAPEVMEDPGMEALPVPEALAAYADEALFEAEQDEEHPLSPEELAKVRTWVKRGLAALWGARKGR
jgi:hypothetical protein